MSKATTKRPDVRVLVTAVLATTLAATADLQASARPAQNPVPTFRVDPDWPTIPNDWVLGEVTSIAVDSNDHVWVLHRPGSIPEELRDKAAPPVLEFDTAGQLLDSWGGSDDGYDWPEREHGAHQGEEHQGDHHLQEGEARRRALSACGNRLRRPFGLDAKARRRKGRSHRSAPCASRTRPARPVDLRRAARPVSPLCLRAVAFHCPEVAYRSSASLFLNSSITLPTANETKPGKLTFTVRVRSRSSSDSTLFDSKMIEWGSIVPVGFTRMR